MSKAVLYFGIICLLVLVVQDVSCARFLIMLPTVVKSHFTMLEPYMKALVTRGHQLVVVSNFPQKQPIANYTDITIEGSMEVFGDSKGINIERVLSNMNPITNVKNLLKFGVANCDSVLGYPSIQNLIKSNEKFDVVINDIFHSDCFLPFAYKFGAINIAVSTSTLMPWANERMGNPDNPSYIPQLFSRYSDKMSFFERMTNALGLLLYRSLYFFMSELPARELIKKHFGEDIPDISELTRNTSLVLVNSYFSLNSPRPLVPGVVEVGGIHITPPKQLPKDLQNFLDGAKHGVIYFSLGSMLQAETFPEEKKTAFLQAFSELPQHVLWKWEGDKMPGQPKNVRIEKWCPQLDILRHPNVLAFMSHGGLLGGLEATYAGVPVIGIPFYGDQFTNLANMEKRGMAIQLHYHNITKETVLEALHTILDQTSYIENARKMARIFRDRPQSALDTAIYWTEYVIRHGGAPHLRSAAVDLSWYQYLLLDVIATMLGIVIIFFVILKKIFATIFKSKKVQAKEKKQ